MEDVRGLLIRSKTVRQVNRKVTRSFTVHWNGPNVSDEITDLQLLQADAKFHVNTRGWDGLSYHYGVGRDGKLYNTRDYHARLAHSGVTQGNDESLSGLVITGEGDTISPLQFAGLEALLTLSRANPRWVLGHSEWPRLTQCPGPLLLRWLTSYRARFRAQGSAITIVQANVRDEASVLSHIVRRLPVHTNVHGEWVLGKPVKGDCLWFRLGNDYIHASTLKGAVPTWAQMSF